MAKKRSEARRKISLVKRKKTGIKKARSRAATSREPIAKPFKSSDDARRVFGRAREDGEALFPAPPPKSELPRGYVETLRELQTRIQQTRLRTVLAANAGMITLYWDLGRTILDRQAHEGWGTKVIDRLSHDLREAFPDMAGLSPRNLKYMRAFAAAWPDAEFVQRLVARIPWRQNIAILEHLDDRDERIWYAQQTLSHGWSQPVLIHHIYGNAFRRQGKLQSNFSLTLPPATSDLRRRRSKIRTSSTSSARPTPDESERSSRR